MVALRLSKAQREVLESTHENRAFIGGIRGGKTFIGALDCVLKAIARPETLTLATSNTYPQLRDVVIPALMRACAILGVTYTWEDGHKVFVLSSGATILCRSLTKPHALRGIEIGHWWGDEARDYSQEAIDVVLGRLSAPGGPNTVFWSTSPHGFGPVHKYFVKNSHPSTHFVRRSRTRDNPFLDPRFDAKMRDAYKGSPEMIAQELDAEDVSLLGSRCYKPFTRARHVDPFNLKYRPTIDGQWGEKIPTDLLLMIDWNVNPLICEVGQELERTPLGLPILDIVCEVVRRNSWVDDLADAIIEQFADHPGKLIINGDATEKRRNVRSDRTTYDLLEIRLRTHFRRVELSVPKKNPPQMARVNSVNYMLAHDRLRIHPSCTMLIDDLEEVSWDRETEQIDKSDLERTHASDGVGYRAWREHRPNFFTPEMERTTAETTR